jgi:hypothetical protein
MEIAMSNVTRTVRIAAFVVGVGLAVGATGVGSAWAQSGPATTATSGTVFRTTGDARKDTLIKMAKRMSLEVTEAKLEDVITFIKDTTQADLEPIYAGDAGDAPGLDREKKVTLNVKNRDALSILETVLQKTKGDFGAGNTWQMTEYGAMQIGPREALNRDRRVEMYDINDLLSIIPRYSDVPEIDLNSVLQQSQGGGGGQSPFTENNRGRDQDLRTREERAADIINIIVANVESEQWSDNGGEAATIRHYNGTLIVNAPDYVHRQIVGYPYWPSYTVRRDAGGKRYVSLNMDNGLARVDGYGRAPVTAVVGGRPVSSNPDGGGLTQPPAKKDKK